MHDVVAGETFLAGSGEMRTRIREFDWAGTPLGPLSQWPTSLRTIISVLVNTHHPMFLWWGPDLIQFYNDGYRPSLGTVGRHPAALGARGREFWDEIWPAIGPQITAVMERGECTWHEDHLVPITRNGRMEEVYWTYGYSPVRNDDGRVGGTLVVVQEQTARVLAARRLRTLRDLAARASSPRTEADAWSAALETLTDNRHDLPWVLMYAVGDDADRVRLVAHNSPVVETHPPLHEWRRLDDGSVLRRLVESSAPVWIDDVRDFVGERTLSPWPEAVGSASLVPIAGPDARIPCGILVAGLSSRLPFDTEYHDFLVMAAQQVAAALTNARSHEEEQRLLGREHAARAAAEHASRMKDEFLATLSHELRTPLNTIVGWTDLLAVGELDPAEAAEGLAAIGRSARMQAQMIEDLLDMSRITSGMVRLNVRPVLVADVVAQAMSSLRQTAGAKRVRLLSTVRVAAADGVVSGDPDRLQQVFWNLLGNAVKFTPAGGRVSVSIERAGTEITVDVSDTGEGLTPDFLPHVFDRFRQADGGSTRAHGGLGIGLSLVKQLVDLHGGTVTASSAGRTLGATFRVVLPAAVAAGMEPAALSASSSSRGGLPPPLDGVRILVVDDDLDGREMVSRILTGCRAHVVAVGSAAEALDALRRRTFDLLVSDIGMRHEDGYDLIRQVRSLPASEGGAIPAVALTAYARPEDRQRALGAGFQIHVAKPIEAAEFLSVCRSLTQRGT